jgi:hypothetical protein
MGGSYQRDPGEGGHEVARRAGRPGLPADNPSVVAAAPTRSPRGFAALRAPPEARTK